MKPKNDKWTAWLLQLVNGAALTVRCSIGLIVLIIMMMRSASAQVEPACVENSPERRGEIGCSLVENKPLPATLKEPLFWHIDRFDSGERAVRAVARASVALQAHGTWWLMTIESGIDNHHGGQHVTHVALPALPPAPKYSMLVMSGNAERRKPCHS